MKIVPTVGRIMLFFGASDDPIMKGADGQPLAALVAHVNPAGTVNLTVSNHRGSPEARQHVRVLQEGEVAEPGEGYATWMPYQLSVAKGDAGGAPAAVVAAQTAASAAMDAATQAGAHAESAAGHALTASSAADTATAALTAVKDAPDPAIVAADPATTPVPRSEFDELRTHVVESVGTRLMELHDAVFGPGDPKASDPPPPGANAAERRVSQRRVTEPATPPSPELRVATADRRAAA